jgi:hypothetical protein
MRPWPMCPTPSKSMRILIEVMLKRVQLVPSLLADVSLKGLWKQRLGTLCQCKNGALF